MKKMTYVDYDAMSTEDLRAMNEMIYGIIKRRSEIKVQGIKNQIHVGAKVKVNHHKTRHDTFTITEIKRKKAVVRNQYGKSYNVPIDLIEIVG